MFTRGDEKVEELYRVPLFAGCSRTELSKISRLVDRAHFAAGQILMQEGRSGRECFVVTEGEADVEIGGHAVARLGPGDIVGEMALLEDEPRSATVVARSPVSALVMSRGQFTAVLDASPAVARRVLRTLAHRLREVQAA